MSDFSSRLREERKRLGMSQEEMAAAGGVKLNAQSNYETDKRSPDVAYLNGLAATGVDVGYLLTGTRSALSGNVTGGIAVVETTEDSAPRYVTREEAALLDNYEAADERGRAAARGVLDALAQPKRSNA